MKIFESISSQVENQRGNRNHDDHGLSICDPIVSNAMPVGFLDLLCRSGPTWWSRFHIEVPHPWEKSPSQPPRLFVRA